jgi:hypothetical protein
MKLSELKKIIREEAMSMTSINEAISKELELYVIIDEGHPEAPYCGGLQLNGSTAPKKVYTNIQGAKKMIAEYMNYIKSKKFRDYDMRRDSSGKFVWSKGFSGPSSEEYYANSKYVVYQLNLGKKVA